jgi:choline-sulfatase
MLVLVLASAAVVLAVAGSTVLRGWARSRSADLSSLVGPGDADGYNLLLVTLDTVRADHLGCYGENDQAETPFLDSLCRNGVMFSDAVTSVPITLPSHTTIMTGLYPPNHGVRDNGTYRLAEERTTLAEDLRSHGYETAAFVGCFVLDARFGLNQGFDRYDFQVTRDGYRPGMVDFNERPASSVTDSVLSWLRERDRSSTTSPFFVWVHYFDAHLPYRSPLQALPRFSSRPYDAEITFADQQFGRLLAELKRERVLERTLIVVVADHGESLGEHGEPTHGMLLYRPTVRVPFIISCPTLFTGTHRVSDQVVGLVDIRPTVEELLGVPPGEDVDGLSLVGSGVTPDRAIYVETEMPHDLAGWSPLYAIRSHERKYIQAPRPELYDVTADPAESHDLSASDPADARAMEQRLSIVAGAMGGVGAERRLSDEERERLAALGYVQTGVAPSAGPLADPKDMMPVYNDALRAERLYQERRIEEAAALATSVLERSPECTPAIRVLSFSDLRLGRPEEAVDLLRSSVRRWPDVFLVRSLAQALIVDKRFAEAEDALGVYEELAPHDGRVPLLRGDIRAKEGRYSDAVAKYERAASLDEPRVGIMAQARISELEHKVPSALQSPTLSP